MTEREDRSEAETFARQLEDGNGEGALLALAQQLREAGPEVLAPAAYRQALRERLIAAPAADAFAPARPKRRRTAWLVAASTGFLLMGGVGAASASEGALPGDVLYPIKRGIEETRLALAGDELSKGRLYLRQADRRLQEAKALQEQGRGHEAAGPLADMAADLRSGASTVAAASGPEADEAAQALKSFAEAAAPQVTQVAAAVPPELEAAVNDTFGEARKQVDCRQACGPDLVTSPQPKPTPSPDAPQPTPEAPTRTETPAQTTVPPAAESPEPQPTIEPAPAEPTIAVPAPAPTEQTEAPEGTVDRQTPPPVG